MVNTPSIHHRASRYPYEMRRRAMFGQSGFAQAWFFLTSPGSQVLTDVQISCTHHDNFARSLPHTWDGRYSGAVVDSNILNSTLSNTTLSNNTLITNLDIAESLADLKTQVQQWLTFEKKQYANSRVSKIERSGTVFVVWFSLWDLWYYSQKTLAEAEAAVTKSMDALFEQLDVIVENWPSELKIIIPEAIDPTFLPGWHTMRTGPRGSDSRGENQRNAILLVEQWNRALDIRAVRWRGGSMYIYNTNEWLLDQVREQQLSTAQLKDANGLGANQSPWNNVRSGCVDYEAYDVLGKDRTAGRCSDPAKYLFWLVHLPPLRCGSADNRVGTICTWDPKL